MIGTYAGLWGAFIGVAVVPSRLVPQAFQSNWLGMARADGRASSRRAGRRGVLIRLLGQAGVPVRATASSAAT